MNTPNEDDLDIASSPSDEEEVPSEIGDEPVEEETPSKKSAESRINELIGKVKEFEEKLETKTNEETHTPMPPSEPTITPEVQRAIDHLRKLGFVHKDELENRVRAVEDRSTLNTEHTRLMSTYDGSDGRPKYQREEVERFMREHAVYDPEIAYEQMHKPELLDYELKKAEEKKKKTPYVEKPGASSSERGDNSITRERIAEAMKTPEGRIWYEKNRPKILSLMQQGQL